VDPFLPLDAEFWNSDRTRYTVFFDPGRQKRGILPNQQMGRSLEIGKRYAIVVSREWPDANGLPLKEEFRKSFTVGPADERPIDVKSWRVSSPRADTRDALVVTFPEPLDHGLLVRALGVTAADGRFLDGEVGIDESEERWAFTPRSAWRAGTYQLTALAMLEDLAGNRIGGFRSGSVRPRQPAGRGGTHAHRHRDRCPSVSRNLICSLRNGFT
jgi:hypothetical protein